LESWVRGWKVQSQPELHSKSLSQNKTNQPNKQKNLPS
jgi:hypothetical protein